MWRLCGWEKNHLNNRPEDQGEMQMEVGIPQPNVAGFPHE